MGSKLGHVIDAVEEIVPGEFAEDWDNSGLQLGGRDWLVERIWVALDPLPEVISAACQKNINLVITHHPLIFKPLAVIDTRTLEGSVIQQALDHHLAIYSAHTNLDRVTDGVNDVLAARIGLCDTIPFPKDVVSGKPGFGRVGELVQPMPVVVLAKHIKEALGIGHVKIAGNLDRRVKRVAVCSGSGSSMVGAFFDTGADVFISGDLKYHDARNVEFAQKALIDIGHFASEHLIVETLAEKLGRHFQNKGLSLAVAPYLLEKDPFGII
jgi:dinuclear metal center YbgI/SA1388 family protein